MIAPRYHGYTFTECANANVLSSSCDTGEKEYPNNNVPGV